MSRQNETDREDCYTGSSRGNQFKTAGHHAIPRIGGDRSGDFSPLTEVELYAAVCRRAVEAGVVSATLCIEGAEENSGISPSTRVG